MTSSIKTIIAAALVATAGSAAFAGPAIVTGVQKDIKSVATVDLVRADQAGTLEVYDFHRGERGALLGSADVNAGANTDVKVRLSAPANKNVEFVLVGNNGAELAATDVNNYQ